MYKKQFIALINVLFVLGCYRERLFRIGKQGHQGIPKVLEYTKVPHVELKIIIIKKYIINIVNKNI
jgi:hypothetical protein